ncbi:MAG: hypothetical protein JWO19_3381 [Bryobacterales bacterium]|jgi:predicted transcriptional regulator|nr:hypothetical protein [Bryobacterales bacterium]
MMASGRLLRAARVLAGLSREELARRAKVSIFTLSRMEGFGGTIGTRATTRRKVEEALKSAGVRISDYGVWINP